MAAASNGSEDRHASRSEHPLPIRAILAHMLGQVFCFTDSDGSVCHFDVGAGRHFAEQRREEALMEFSPAECGIDMDRLRLRYPDLDTEYALSLSSEAMAVPVLFIPWKGKHLLIDGYHRVARAVLTNVETMQAYLLTEEEAEATVIAKVPPPVRCDTPPSGANAARTVLPKFAFGRIVATPAAIAALQASAEDGVDYLERHLTGDWGELDAEDRKANDQAVENGGQILSAYRLQRTAWIWIITDANRAATTILTPSDY